MSALFILWLVSLNTVSNNDSDVLLPISTLDRKSVEALRLTEIGKFGIERKARPGIPGHLHSGIDIRRPADNYQKEQFIFPVAKGTVISKRTDGPYAQLIIEHELDDMTFWTVYEHIAGVSVGLFQKVGPHQPIARFFNGDELDRYGWQFDHFHFEILKIRPVQIEPNSKTPERLFNSYTLLCRDLKELHQYFYDPIEFLKKKM